MSRFSSNSKHVLKACLFASSKHCFGFALSARAVVYIVYVYLSQFYSAIFHIIFSRPSFTQKLSALTDIAFFISAPSREKK